MNRPLLAIGLDGADIDLLERWTAQGHLPTINELLKRSRHSRLRNFDSYRAEVPWTTFLTGVAPENTGYWGRIQYNAQSCSVAEFGAYDFKQYPPFYSLLKNKRVCVFDMPQTVLRDDVDGLQMLAWGAHSPRGPSVSRPRQLFSDIVGKYDEHPRLNDDHANIYDAEASRRLRDDFIAGIQRRTQICLDLLAREEWGLFLTLFSESHSAGHTFWHLGQPHPLRGLLDSDGDYLLDVFKAIDESLQQVLSQHPQCNVALFSVHGMVANVLDVSSMLLLPELLYRKFIDADGALAQAGDLQEPLQIKFPEHWSHELWARRNRNAVGIEGPDQQRSGGHSLAWQAANWYQQRWRQMPAFALPSYSDGYIRLNLVGRDSSGLVPAESYHKVCDELIDTLHLLRDARTGKEVVRSVKKIRQNALDTSDKLPDADLVVRWQEGTPFDSLIHPDFGQLGPVPHFRTGGHRNLGFVAISGPDIDAATLPDRSTLELTPALLKLAGVHPPNYMAQTDLV